MAYSPVMATDNTAGTGDGVAIGNGSKAPKAENVAIGKGAEIKYSNGASSATGDVIVGSGAVIDNYASQGGSIAIGKNAKIENMTGKQESAFALGQTKYHKGNFLGTLQIPDNPENVAGSIALGDNTYARTGSIMIGSHNYRGQIGDQTVDTSKTKDYGININATTLGTNSFNQGAFSSVTGAYSIISGKYDGSGFSSYSAQNFGATITGSLNSIESATSSNKYSGIANSIVGVANRASNSNGSLIFGAGNEIKNSITDISAPTSGGDSAKALQDSLMKAVHDSNSGGATLVIGGGNAADYTQKTQIIGVNNTVTGTNSKISAYNLIDGYNNKATHVKHATVIGSGNTVSGEEKDNVEGLILLGDNRNVWSRADNSVVIGSSDDTGHSYVTRPDTVVIGHNAYIEDHGGNTSGGGDIAIGHNSFIENYVNQSGSIAFGENTHVRNSVGSTENAFIMGQYETTQDSAGTSIPTDVAKMNASIAIGENTFARTGSLMIGTHKYTGKIGDTTVDTSDATSMAQANQQINETVLGTNSFSLGAFSTVTGAYSIISGDYEKGKWRNFGSSITGSLNSIESKTATTADAGNASHIIGTANRMQNANGAVVIGSGNEITDSYAAMSMPTSNNISAKDLSEKIRESIKANGGGAAAIVGNGNEVKMSTNVAVMGSKNSVTSTTNSQIFGDNRIVASTDGQAIDGAVIVGSADATAPLTTNKKNVTILGYNANAIVEGGVALGAGSVSSVDKEVVGYDPSGTDHSGDTTGTWKSKAAAVSVGDASKNITRQITNVAAGKELTDAVNVAQLRSAQIHYYGMNPSGTATGVDSNYNNDGATGNNAIAIGPFTSAKGSHSLALGYHAEANHFEDEPLAGEDGYDDNTAIGYSSQAGYRSTALGYNSQATGGRAVALGTDALAEQNNSTAVGMNAQATGEQATALGSLAKASGESATAVGEGASALADYSSAVGQGAIVDTGASKGTALGYQAKVFAGAENSMALGASSQVSGLNSIAIGMSAQVSSAKSIAIGNGATVSADNSVALGNGSVASGNLNDYNVMSLTIPNLGTTYNVRGGWPSGIVSVGNDKVVRTITNVAAGRVTPTSTDAVNGSELYAVATEAAKHATVKAAANSRVTVDNKGVNNGLGIEYTIGLNTNGLAALTDGLKFAGDDGQSDKNKVISRQLNEQLNIIGGATDTVDANNIGVIKTNDNTLNIRLATDITGLTSLQATTVTSGNVTVNGTDNVITGLSNTTWDKTKDYSQSTKAATEAQLHEAMTQVAADANDTHIQAGDYAVGTITDKDGQSVQGVSMDVVDKTGKVGTVRITDVAKASDVGDVTGLNKDIQNAEGKTTVVDAVNNVDNKVGNLDYSSTKYVTKGEDVTTSIGKLDEAIKNASEAAGKHTIVSTTDSNLSVKNVAKEGDAANYQISMNKDLNVDSVTATNKIKTKNIEATGAATIGKVTINKDNKGTIGGLTNKTWDAKNITSGQAATEDQLQAATKNAVNYDGDDSKSITLREDTTIKSVADTTIEEGSKNAVNAGTVYNETRVAKDGTFIRQANTAGENLTALDHQVAANTESIYHINNRVSNLDNRINKVGAGAAALAALHPLDFDPDDKWDFAVGYGNYRNANSVAFGAFYRPNEDIMFSLGTNFGNGENMFNAGLSFKIGQGGSGITTSKTAMAKTISSLKDTVHKQDQKIEGLENVVDTQDKKIAELEALVKEQGEMIRQYVGKK
ncbi:YadA-like family protein [uncultured Megasphaera sp.]|uniref:YadA-like family protein n=1 Tax=uncultured Megasphaera sp. TaxID=165188 RepID=UPI0025DFDE45|nr:YadA-like family protein [uncultured Megasphaera sp.]